MSLLDTALEVHVYNSNRISIKDLQSDLTIEDSKWNLIFNFALQNSQNSYFLGERVEYPSKNLSDIIDELAEMELLYGNDSDKVLFRIKPTYLLINRKRLADIWLRYEYPAIIFLGENATEDDLVLRCNANNTYEEIVGFFDKIYLFHRNFETNVLWILKGVNSPKLPVN
jgi:hypothetical protein